MKTISFALAALMLNLVLAGAWNAYQFSTHAHQAGRHFRRYHSPRRVYACTLPEAAQDPSRMR